MTIPLFILVVLATGPLSHQAKLTVLSAGAVEEGVAALARSHARDSGREIVVQFGTGPEIEKRLAAGESVDVLIAPAAVVERAIKAGRISAEAPTPVARVGVGIAVRRGAPLPAVSTVEALKGVLLGADSVVYNQASTGLYLEKLFADIGILEQLKTKTTRYGNAAQVLEHVIAGRGIEIGFGPITEIKTYEPKGLVLVADLPETVQNSTTYVAVAARGRREAAAGDFVRYLTSEDARRTFAATGAQ
jgi:molybdate transport system substrate-binding protein